MKPDPIIDRSPEQKLLRLEKLRAELKLSGYSVVSTVWLSSVLKVLQPKALDKMLVAAE